MEESQRQIIDRAIQSLTQGFNSQSNRLSDLAQSSLSIQRLYAQISKSDYTSIAASITGATAHQSLSSFVRQLDAIKHILPSQFSQQQLLAVTKTLSSGINQQLSESLRESVSHSFSLAQYDVVKESLYSISRFVDPQQLNLLSKTISNASSIDTQKLGALAGSQIFASLKYAVPELSSDRLATLASSFSGRLAGSIAKALESLEEDPNAFEPVEELVRTKIDSLSTSRISAEGLWQIYIQILALLIGLSQLGLTIYQINEAKKSSGEGTELFKKLVETTQKIAANTERLVPKQDQNTYYIVERTVNLQIKPSADSQVLALLFPNQKVRLVKRKHKWIYIEFFDYLEGVPKYGWALKKYLRSLELGMRNNPRVSVPKSVGGLLPKAPRSAFPGIEITPGVSGGEPRIARTRIPVWVLEEARRFGISEPEILQIYPTLRAEDLANAWAYVRAHQEEIEQQIRENEAA